MAEKRLAVWGTKRARKVNQEPAYERVIKEREITYVCAQCGNPVTRLCWPGPHPAYCDPCRLKVNAERKEQQRIAARERMRRNRGYYINGKQLWRADKQHPPQENIRA